MTNYQTLSLDQLTEMYNQQVDARNAAKVVDYAAKVEELMTQPAVTEAPAATTLVRIALTGHRPKRLGGYDYRSPLNIAIATKIREQLLSYLNDGKQIHAISGMALGADTIFALVALKLKQQGYAITLESAIPCANHSSQWPKASQEQWQVIVDQADKVTYVSNEPYRPALMQTRNIYMVNNCDVLLAVYDGTKGGTQNCVNYAVDHNKKVITIDPTTVLNKVPTQVPVATPASPEQQWLVYVKGDLLESDCNVILHQANCMSTMGSGIAKQIATRYPIAAKADRDCSFSPEGRLGKFSVGIDISKGEKHIVNLYGQLRYGRDKQHTDYTALQQALESFFEEESARLFPRKLSDKKFGVPFNMGCGTGGGDWAIVSRILNGVAAQAGVQIHVYQLGPVPAPKVLECSTKGDKRFSAYHAVVEVSGVSNTIEWHYQMCKRFGTLAPISIAEAKGKAPSHIELNGHQLETRFLTPFYKMLWVKYLDKHPELVQYASRFDQFTDMFRGKAINCQADVIQQYVKEGRVAVLVDCQELIAILKTSKQA